MIEGESPRIGASKRQNRHMTDQGPEGHRHWTDEPLKAEDEDDLGRRAFVATVAQRIELATATDPSTVFGLVGPWGSGKTSIIAKVRSSLSPDWYVGDFTPWSSGDSTAMSLEFVSTLASVLGKRVKGDLRRKLAEYASHATPMLAAIPLIGSGVGGSAKRILDTVATRPPWHKQFDALSTEIQALGRRVLIVVDDVDRLGGDELLNLLRILRLLGRFRGVHYLVAYDQETVEDLLVSTGSVGRSASFMEKIVQYPFEIPPISQATVIRLFDGLIQDLLAETGQRLDELGIQRASEITGILAPQIRTPRTLGRFGEQLRAFAQHVVDAELDVLDYVAMTWLRVSAHGVWSALPDWRDALESGRRSLSLTESRDISTQDWEDWIGKVGHGRNSASTVRILSFLFPGVSVGGISSFVRHPRAAAEASYFGRYMLLALPEDDVSDELIGEVVNALVTDTATERLTELAQVLDSADDALATLGYGRASALRRESTTTSRVFLQFLVDRFNARRDEAARVGSPRNGLRVWLSREVALGLTTGVCDARDVIEWIGEEESFTLILFISRLPDYRERARELADDFADYWIDQLPTRLDTLIAESKLGGISDLVVFARGAANVAGMLDFAVPDFDSYVRVAESFVTFNTWVGSGDVEYEAKFRGDQFAALISPPIREKFANQVAEAKTGTKYAIDELPVAQLDPEIRREFTLDSLSVL